ncbi:hypothetical protein BdWA1_003361 [Babesia duncani]|uniref:Uncharacterized protein n=1 Tax=Babesia duncani TaxID=323732 RepID=A0AAD9PHM7_9APIC|nr:hypothetical protein BdWA1_003813 [Babesia duncani]KAK2195061.1 hypothetical protein BdWA1_003361 [Babesia duncani]
MDLKLFTVLVFLGINAHSVISSPQNDEGCNELRQSAINLLFKIHDPDVMLEINTKLKDYSVIQIIEEGGNLKGFEDETTKTQAALISSEVDKWKRRLFDELKSISYSIRYFEEKVYKTIQQQRILSKEEESNLIQMLQNKERRVQILDVHYILARRMKDVKKLMDIKLYDPFMDEFKKYVDSKATKSEKYLKELEGLEVIKNHPKILAAAKSLIEKYFAFFEHFNKVFEEYRERAVYMEGRGCAETD